MGAQKDSDNEAVRNPAKPQLQWLALAIDHLYEKPSEPVRPDNERTTPFHGREVKLEFIAGSLRGIRGRPLPEPPAVRLTAGGRPMPGVAVVFEVTDGAMGNEAQRQVLTDARGVARVMEWRLGDAGGTQGIAAECGTVRTTRSVQVSN